MKVFLKNNLILFLLIPIFINFCLNILNGSKNLLFFYSNNFYFLISIAVSFYFYLILSKYLKIFLKIESRSLAIAYFFSSFFLIDLLLFPLISLFDVKELHLFILLGWFLLIIYKMKSFTKTLHLIAAYSVMFVFNHYFFAKLNSIQNYIEWNSDVPQQWAKIGRLIADEGLFYTYLYNPIRGQGLFISSVQSTIFKLNFPLQEFQFMRINSNLFLLLTCLFFFELRISRNNKYYTSLIFCFFILNSDWLTYLFVDSLMLEGILSLLFAIFIYKSQFYLSKTLSVRSLIFYFFFSSIFFSKQFISTLAIMYLLYLLIFKLNINMIPGLAVLCLEKLYSYLYIPHNNSSELIDGRSIVDLFLDLLYLRDIDLTITIDITKEFSRDKVALLIFFFFIFYNIFWISYPTNYINNAMLIIISLNISFIFILYMSWWKNIEVQSSYRYFLNCLHLIMISIAVRTSSEY